MNLSSLIAKIKYKQDCDDKVMEASSAGIATRFFQMVVMLLWRIVTVTMVAFFLRNAQTVGTRLQRILERDFKKTFCIEDDELFIEEYQSSFDGTDADHSSDSSVVSARLRA